ncbi:MAG: protein-glutamate O-methyltransferase CheR [Anaeromyxobacteraceae bacterium]
MERTKPAARGLGDAFAAAAEAHRALTHISDADFAKYQALVNREAGIWLAPVKKALLVGRLARRLRELAIHTYADYYERVMEDPAERTKMVDAICTNETHFFREPRHWEFLAETIYPAWQAQADAGKRERKVRVWSAACSSGEEPYSLAMSLLTAFPAGWSLEVLATDLSTKILDRARAATWPIAKAAEIPEAYLKAFMLKGFGDYAGTMRAGPEIRSLIRFERFNLNGDEWPPAHSFDLVFCRNVLIYFDRATKERVVSRLLDRLSPTGNLFLGHAESLGGFTDRVHSLIPTVYALGAPTRGGRPR